MENNELWGFEVDDDGFEYSVYWRSLYTEDTIKELINSGYTYKGYYGCIENSEGINILDLVSKEIDMSEMDKISMELAGDSCLSESDATVYFKQEVKEDEAIVKIETKESSNSITSKEDFIKYLGRFSASSLSGVQDLDNMPINSFVSKEALFSVDDIKENPTIGRYFRIMADRRIYSSYKGLENIFSNLKRTGVMEEDTNSLSDLIKAYMS